MTAPTTTTEGESRMRKRIGVAALAVVAALVTALPAVAADNPKKDKDTYVQLLAFNDFHGHVKAVNDLGQSIPGTIQIGQSKNPRRARSSTRPFPRAAPSTCQRR